MVNAYHFLPFLHDGAGANLGEPDVVTVGLAIVQEVTGDRKVERVSEQDLVITQLVAGDRKVQQVIEFPNVER